MKARGIYFKTLSMFFIVYLVLMVIFSNQIIREQKERNRASFLSAAYKASEKIWNVINKYSNEDNEITDIISARKEIIYQSLGDGMEMAIFDSDFQLFYSTSDLWVISYAQRLPGTNSMTQFGFLKPEDWFTEEEILKMEDLMYGERQAKKVGDITDYHLELGGFWLDGTRVIPERVIVKEERVLRFDEEGYVANGVITESEVEYGFETNYQNTEELPYVEAGTVEKDSGISYGDGGEIILRRDERQKKIRERVLDVNMLQDVIIKRQENIDSYENIKGFRQQSYIAIPYKDKYLMDALGMAGTNYCAVFADESSALQDSMDKLIPIWSSSFVIFMLAAVVLAYSNYNTYKKKETMNKQHRELTSALAHDLKTPLAIISGYSENLKENIHSEKREYYASKIQDKAVYMDGIIKEMLELSRLETGNVKLNKEELSLNELSQSAYNRYIEVINEKNIHFSIEGDSIILGDRNLILKVIDNFIINAISFTPENGRIEIEISDKVYGIYNSGSHIPEEKIDDIWTAYTKGDDSRSISQGTGLGLYIAGEILKLHKLVYGARNTGDGVRFWFSLKRSAK